MNGFGAWPGLRRRGQVVALLLTALLSCPSAWAGRTGQECSGEAPTLEALDKGLRLAQATEQALQAGGARVWVLARAGQDLSRYGLRWSHLGFAYQAETGGPWRVLHKLNDCGGDRGPLYRQGLAEFFLDSPHRYEAVALSLSATAQAALLPQLSDNAALQRLHEPRYSMLAYPWATRYQQSNQWALETLAAALQPDLQSRAQAQAWLRARAYEPTRLHLDTLTRLGARLSRANIAFDDHPDAQRYAGQIDTVSADSVLQWLSRTGLGGRHMVIGLPGDGGAGDTGGEAACERPQHKGRSGL